MRLLKYIILVLLITISSVFGSVATITALKGEANR